MSLLDLVVGCSCIKVLDEVQQLLVVPIEADSLVLRGKLIGLSWGGVLCHASGEGVEDRVSGIGIRVRVGGLLRCSSVSWHPRRWHPTLRNKIE